MNRENILVRGDRVTGLLDFGDNCFNPVVCDLAICLAYVKMDPDNPNWFGSEESAWDLLVTLRDEQGQF
jgi:Ser/Thr protein kinase RdoA (MazF antagonist)